MSSPSHSYEKDMKSREERVEEMDNEIIPYHRFNHMLGEEMVESISPSVPFLEVSSFNTWDDTIRTELDSHANMVVLGRHCRLENPDIPVPGSPGSRYAIVSAFSPDYKPMKIQIVDACIGYWCPTNETTYILHFNDVLYVPSMEHNLIPPFILREAGFIVNDTPRIHCQDVTKDSHTIISEDGDLRMPLRLHGVFSYFPSFKPDDDHYHSGSSNEHYLLTPTGNDWNPNTGDYKEAENYYIDENGDIIPTRMNDAKEYKDYLLNSQRVNVRDGLYELDSLSIPEGYEVEISAIAKLCTIAQANLVPETDNWKIVPDANISNSTAQVTEPSDTLDWEIVSSNPRSSFSNNIIARNAMGEMAMSIGSICFQMRTMNTLMNIMIVI